MQEVHALPGAAEQLCSTPEPDSLHQCTSLLQMPLGTLPVLSLQKYDVSESTGLSPCNGRQETKEPASHLIEYNS